MFNMPLDDYTVTELENKMFGSPDIILKSDEMSSFVDNFKEGKDALRLMIIYPMLNSMKLINSIADQTFKTERELMNTPINMSQFIFMGAQRLGLVYNKECSDYLNHVYETQKEYYKQFGEEIFVQFLGYLCAGICVWKEYMNKNLEEIVAEQGKYFINLEN